MKKIKCESGTTEWKEHLQNVCENFGEFQLYSRLYDITRRLGFKTEEEAWEKNPLIQGSVNPRNFRIAKKSS